MSKRTGTHPWKLQMLVPHSCHPRPVTRGFLKRRLWGSTTFKGTRLAGWFCRGDDSRAPGSRGDMHHKSCDTDEFLAGKTPEFPLTSLIHNDMFGVPCSSGHYFFLASRVGYRPRSSLGLGIRVACFFLGLLGFGPAKGATPNPETHFLVIWKDQLLEFLSQEAPLLLIRIKTWVVSLWGLFEREGKRNAQPF